jgi:malate synthase
MVHVIRPVWEQAGEDNRLGRRFHPLTHTAEDARALLALEHAPRTVRGARDLLSVGLQYGNAFLRGFQAAALKPADFFGDPGVLYLMEDMATGEIRLSILWEWLHKGALLAENGGAEGEPRAALTPERFGRLLEEEHAKLLAAADRDVHDDSKHTTLPAAVAIVDAYVRSPVKPPWYIDLLHLALAAPDPDRLRTRIDGYLAELERTGARLTANPDFDPVPA